VLAWLDRPGVRLVAATGWAEPAAGGRALTEAVEEARRVARQVRRDQQVLAGAKVVRRRPSPPDGLSAAALLRRRVPQVGAPIELEQAHRAVGLQAPSTRNSLTNPAMRLRPRLTAPTTWRPTSSSAG
jgi:hypothetical protein